MVIICGLGNLVSRLRNWIGGVGERMRLAICTQGSTNAQVYNNDNYMVINDKIDRVRQMIELHTNPLGHLICKSFRFLS